ncbi:hypothetical protein MNAN1_002800 [Malassezia nana]|uniref:Uncharacterized protein n=1 Tax=Malassezia nana TaxID=180528 RepID=A0AAF0EKS4_9BASI|nr:hypothetical protein MNAN1_002800 [Malassezia nana]
MDHGLTSLPMLPVPDVTPPPPPSGHPMWHCDGPRSSPPLGPRPALPPWLSSASTLASLAVPRTPPVTEVPRDVSDSPSFVFERGFSPMSVPEDVVVPRVSSPPPPIVRRMQRPPPLMIPSRRNAPTVEDGREPIDSMYMPDSVPTCVSEVVDYLDDDRVHDESGSEQRFLDVLEGVHSEIGRVMDEVYITETALADAFQEMNVAVDSTRGVEQQYDLLQLQEEIAGERFNVALGVLRRLDVDEEDAENFLRYSDTHMDPVFFRVVRHLQEQRDDANLLSASQWSLHIHPTDDLLSYHLSLPPIRKAVIDVFLALAKHRLTVWLHHKVTTMPLRAVRLPELVVSGLVFLIHDRQLFCETLYLFSLSRVQRWCTKFEREHSIQTSPHGHTQLPSHSMGAGAEQYLIGLLVWVYQAVHQELRLLVSFFHPVLDQQSSFPRLSTRRMQRLDHPAGAVHMTVHLIETSLHPCMRRLAEVSVLVFKKARDAMAVIRMLKIFAGVRSDLVKVFGQRTKLNRPLQLIAESVPEILRRKLSRQAWGFIDQGDMDMAFVECLKLLHRALKEATMEADHTGSLVPIIEQAMFPPLRYLMHWHAHRVYNEYKDDVSPSHERRFSARQWHAWLILLMMLHCLVQLMHPFRPFCDRMYERIMIQTQATALQLVEERYYLLLEASGLLDLTLPNIDQEAVRLKWLGFLQRTDLLSTHESFEPIEDEALRYAVHMGAMIRFGYTYERLYKRSIHMPDEAIAFFLLGISNHWGQSPEELVQWGILRFTHY